jgi:hypothetical protein
MRRRLVFGIVAVTLSCSIASRGADEPIRHRFLAVDTLAGKQGLHYVDEVNPTNDWSVAGNWRDIQLIGAHRVALSDGNGVSVVDLKTRKVTGTLRPKRTDTVIVFEKGPISPDEEGGTEPRKTSKEVIKDLKNVLSFRYQPNGHIIFCMTGRGLTVTDPSGVTQKDLIVTNANGLVRPTGDGGWAFTVMGNGGYFATDVAGDGTERARIPVPGSKPVYMTCKLANGNYLVTAGYGGFAAELKTNGEMVKRYATINKFFYSGFQVLTNGNLVVANWTGHNEGERRKPNQGDQIVEFAPDGKVVWSYNNLDRLGCIHGVIVMDDLDPALPYEQVYGVLVRVPLIGSPPP